MEKKEYSHSSFSFSSFSLIEIFLLFNGRRSKWNHNPSKEDSRIYWLYDICMWSKYCCRRIRISNSKVRLLRRWVFFFIPNQEMTFRLSCILKKQMKAKRVQQSAYWIHLLAYGRFESPEHANVLATMPAEVFLQVYSGEASLSLISRMIFRGKISVVVEWIDNIDRFETTM